ncbi:helix-turn-helix domain-containing protein [Macrococcus sp. EM39E]|uniref:helix-turn-helix domain-containing protein n=1 Tax=Macrococcus animalis TaxID=3395467 RepID=UPI0039BE6CA3
MTNEEIANAIKYHRENLDFSGKEMAYRLNMSPSTYSKIENGERTITAVELYQISLIFNLSIDEVLTKRGRRG